MTMLAAIHQTSFWNFMALQLCYRLQSFSLYLTKNSELKKKKKKEKEKEKRKKEKTLSWQAHL